MELDEITFMDLLIKLYINYIPQVETIKFYSY